MARSVKAVKQEPHKKKTVRVLVPKSENTRAQRIYLLLVGMMIWAGLIKVALIFQQIILQHKLNAFAAVIELVIFFCMVTGLIGIIKVKPPLHHLIPFGALINLIPSYFLGTYGVIFGMVSILILYIAIRFPIHFEWEKRSLEK